MRTAEGKEIPLTMPLSNGIARNKPPTGLIRKERLSREAFKAGLGILGYLLPDLANDPAKVQIFYAMLSDLPQDRFLLGIKVLIARHREVFPGTNVIALIRDYAMWDDYMSAEEAWGEVQKAVKAVGYFQSLMPMLKNEMIYRAVEVIGTRAVRTMENEDMVRNHFYRVYNSLVDRKKNDRIREMVCTA